MCGLQLLCSSILVVIVKTQEAGQADAAASCLLPLGGGSTPSGNFPVDLNGCKKALKHYMVRPAKDLFSGLGKDFASTVVLTSDLVIHHGILMCDAVKVHAFHAR